MENEVGQINKIFSETPAARKFPLLPSLIAVIVIGIISGFFLSKKYGGKEEPLPATMVSSEKIKPGVEFGSKNQNFKDTTIGVLERGGIDGEGTHHLVREGGPSQNAYLTSSVLDLDQFVGKKVQVWGETFKGQKAGWLMDVGRIKILE